ncbi:MAG: serine/threonine-protein kinase, partial [Pseudomonadota bacterium]
VGVHQIFHDNGTAYMAMDYVAGRNLLEIIEDEPNRFTPEDVRQLLIQCLEALDYIHSRDILHRDISPDNIIIGEDNTPVMIDFGAARESATRVSRVLSKVLTVKDGYSPQEFYLQGTAQVYSSDLYALAATFYHLLSGIAPPSSNMRVSAAARNAPDPLEPLEDIEGYDEHFIDAINACLSIFPKDRLPTAPVWRDMVDMDRRRKILMAAAENDRELEEKVTRLVADFRKTLAREKAAERIRAEEAAAAKRRAAEEARQKAEAAARAQAEEEAAILAEEQAALQAEQEAKEQAVRAEKEAALAAAAAAAHEAAQSQAQSEPGSLKRMMSGRRKFFPGFAKARGQ